MKKFISPKDCPLCDKMIYDFDKNGKPVKLNKNGLLFWVKFNDNSNAVFAVCKDCYSSLNKEKLDELMISQIYTWGREILDNTLSMMEFANQLSWFVNSAVSLRIIKFALTKEELDV
jgi:hypothetical protein